MIHLVYGDTSFFIGLMDKSDAHNPAAMRLQKRFQNSIETSVITVAELLQGCEEHEMDAEKVINSIFEITKVHGITLEQALTAARLVNEKKLKSIDAIHCALAGDEIISADKDFDRTSIKRIWAEKSE